MEERELYPRGLTDERIERDAMARISRNLMDEMFPGCSWDDLEDDEREEFEREFNYRAYRHY
jgi:hypothetical protein